MVLPKVIGSFFTVGVVAIGTLAGASVFGAGIGPRRSLAVAPGRTLAAAETRSSSSDQIPSYLGAANQLWTSTHDSRTVRKMLELALEELDASDARQGRARAAREIPASAELPRDADAATGSLVAPLIPIADGLEAPLAPVVFRLPKPMLISTRGREGQSLHFHADWRKRWGAWHANLVKIPQPFANGSMSAIEISIETW
jgi:hypothetical protein